jgi:shikimate dehydrogenase
VAEGAPEQLTEPARAIRRAAVIGHPVSHSLSPVMHRAAYAALGLDGWGYDARDVDEHALPAFLDGLDGTWAGLSVTMPLKHAVRDFLVDESDLAAQVGAVNTVVIAGDGRHGYNTDVYGIINALAEAGVTALAHATVLGGGATAASALAALRDLGCAEPLVAVRSPQRSGRLREAAERLGVRPRFVPLDDSAALAGAVTGPGGAVVSTLPAGAADPLCGSLLDAGSGGRDQAPVPLLDVVYAPWPTALASAWRRAGGTVVGGFSMLVHQAEGQVRLMTGQRPPLELMRAAGQAELDARGR